MTKEYTLKELKLYDGKQEGGKILIALDGQVYDVTTSGGFYGPGGSYELFAGRDATRGLATQSLEAGNVPDPDGPLDDLSNLTDENRNNLRSWKLRFDQKYTIVGKLVAN